MDNLALNLAQFIKEKSGVSRLTLTDFRNYAHLRINAKLAPIIITGENGSGNAEKLSGVGPINGFVRSMGCEQTAN